MTLPQQPRPRLSSFQSLASSVLPFGALVSLRSPQPARPPPPSLSRDTHMHLSTQCHSCGEKVAVEVPAWMAEAMEGRSERLEGSEGGKGDRREGFVGAAVRIAVAIKESPIPAMCVAVVTTLFSFILFLDQRFSLHQRLAVLVSKLLESLIEIEKEVGLFRNAGETVSVLWEAAVKSTIAMAKSPPSSSTPTFTVSSFPQPDPHPLEPLPNLARQRTLRTAHSTSSLPHLRGPSSLGPFSRPNSIPFPANSSAISTEYPSGMRHRRSRSEELEFGIEGVPGERQRTASEVGEQGMGWGARVVGGVVGRVGRAVGGSS